MDLRIGKSVIAVIKQEQGRRDDLLHDDPTIAHDQWLFTDEPFINELCLMFLVALRHQVERQLVHLAARAGDSGSDLTRKEYDLRLQNLRRGKTGVTNWDDVERLLQPKVCIQYQSIEALRLLANAYKHDPNAQPSTELLNHLGLPTTVNYADLPESGALREGLAVCVGLNKGADYCEIAERFVDCVEVFLNDVQRRVPLSRIEWAVISNSLDDFAR
jgi:hypothetical protein